MATEAGKGIKEARVSEENSEPLNANGGVASMDEVQNPIDLDVEQLQLLDAQGQLTVQQLVVNSGDEGILRDASDVSV